VDHPIRGKLAVARTARSQLRRRRRRRGTRRTPPGITSPLSTSAGRLRTRWQYHWRSQLPTRWQPAPSNPRPQPA